MVGSIREGPGASWEPHGGPVRAGSVGDGHYLCAESQAGMWTRKVLGARAEVFVSPGLIISSCWALATRAQYCLQPHAQSITYSHSLKIIAAHSPLPV